MVVSKDLKIEIRPIPNRNDIKQFSEDLEYFSQSNIIAPFVNPVSRKYDTGLSKEDVEYLKENNFPYDLSDDYIMGVVHPFWESQIVKTQLLSTPIFLHPGRNLLDFVKWKYLLVNKYIYKSEAEMLSGTKPAATHFIYDESEETAIRATKLQKINNLIKEVSKLSLARKRNIILIIENENTDNKNEDYLTVRFDDIIKNPEKASLLESLLNEDKELVELSATIKSAIQKNVLRRTKKGIFYFETNLGYSEEDVRDFLSKDENQEILLTIKDKL